MARIRIRRKKQLMGPVVFLFRGTFKWALVLFLVSFLFKALEKGAASKTDTPK